MDEDVERVVRARPSASKTRAMSVVGLDVARLDERRRRSSRRAAGRACSMRLSIELKPTSAPCVVERLGDPPGDRVVVGDAEDERLLAVEQSHPCSSSHRVVAGAYHRRMSKMTPPTPTADTRSRRRPRHRPRPSCGPPWPARGPAARHGRRHRRGRPADPGRGRGDRPLEATGFPYRIVTNYVGGQPCSPGALGRTPRGGRPPGTDHHGAVRCGRVHGPRLPGPAALRPRVADDAKTEFGRPAAHHPRGGGAPGARAAAVVIGDSPEDGHLREPQPRLPPGHARGGADRHAPQPRGGSPPDGPRSIRAPSWSGWSTRPGVRARVARQALAPSSLECGRASCAASSGGGLRRAARHRDGRRRPPARTCWAASAPACAASSSSPASTGPRSWTAAERRPGRAADRMPCARSLVRGRRRARLTGNVPAPIPRQQPRGRERR